ncbi:hypothetical protein HDU76_001809 [Blyttiomyces sp. JEL0837]|nr:hypothetical protein HDU76_001809 [Blyttiomyces sp. JEL0837]
MPLKKGISKEKLASSSSSSGSPGSPPSTRVTRSSSNVSTSASQSIKPVNENGKNGDDNTNNSPRNSKAKPVPFIQTDPKLLAARSLNICMVSDFFYPNFGGVESHIYFLSLELSRRGHKAFSSMSHEAILNAKTMGLPAVFTDHSLFGFEDVSSILMNKLLKFTLSDIDHVICVSHTSKENTVLRAALDPHDVSVIPNAVVADDFTPDPTARSNDKITIVVVSRLVYRKGTDLLVAIIPKICALFPEVNFLIGGDGPKRIELEQMREKYVLQDRVTVVGAVKHADVRKLLVQGHIFLNTSLTEAFCIAIVEAACCGLLVVCTKVGGVPEVLPDHMVVFAEPEQDDLVRSLEIAVKRIRAEPIDVFQFHEDIKSMYSWADVAERTETVYMRIVDVPPQPLARRFYRYHGVGLFAGKLSVMIVAVSYMLLCVLEWLCPRASVEIAPPFTLSRFQKSVEEDRKRRERKANLSSEAKKGL